jgi:hypothetical protein
MALTQILTTDSVSASVVNAKIVDPANVDLDALDTRMDIAETDIDALQTAAGTAATHIGTANIHVKITSGTADPTGGIDGDVYLQYEA